jgi:hypothetical protein
VKIFHRLISHGICLKFRRSVPFTRLCTGIHHDRNFHPTDFSHSRCETRPAAAFGGITPASPGSGGLRPPPGASHLQISHRLISHGIPKTYNFHLPHKKTAEVDSHFRRQTHKKISYFRFSDPKIAEKILQKPHTV